MRTYRIVPSSLLALSLVCAPTAKPRTEAGGTVSAALEVQIYNYAGVKDAMVLEAAASALGMFTRAGVPTRWVLCRPSPSAAHCDGWGGPEVVAMRITPAARLPKSGINRLVYGFAIPSRTGGYAKIASAFWDRVEEAASVSGVDAADLLAAVMAHEIGHLVLGLNSHSKVGLMSNAWGPSEIAKIRQGSFHFWGSDGVELRRAVERRLAASSTRQEK